MRRAESRTMLQIVTGITLGTLGFAGCKWIVGDENPHPIAGRVDQVSEPTWECHYSAATKTNSDCGYHYYLFVNGCVELPEEVQAYVDEHAPDRPDEYGWVEVSPDTWSEHQSGEYIYFSGRGFLDRIFADQEDQNHTC